MTNAYWNFLSRLSRFSPGRAEQMNSLFDGIASGFDKIPNLDDFIYSSGDYAVPTGTGNPYVITLKPTQISSYIAGLRIRFKANVANPSGGTSINLNGIGVKSILTSSGGVLPSGTIPAGSIVDISYDGTAFRLAVQSPSPLYAALSGATFTGSVKVPTTSTAADALDVANVTMLRAYVAALVASAPSTLDTLNELAAALGNDPNFATTVTNALAAKAAKATKIRIGNGLSLDGVAGSDATPAEGDLSANRLIALNLADKALLAAVWSAGTSTTEAPISPAKLDAKIKELATVQKIGKSPAGTLVDFSGGDIPAGVQRVVLSFSNIIVSASTRPIIRIGSAADGILSTGYVCVASAFGDAASPSVQNVTDSIPGDLLNSAGPFSGTIVLTRLIDKNSTRWSFKSSVCSHVASPRRAESDGYIILSGDLDRIRFTTPAAATLSGSSASSITASYEF